MAEDIDIQAWHRGANLSASRSRPTEEFSGARETTLVIMLHSLPGDRNTQNNLFHDLEFLLRDKGYHTLRFDFYGCGTSGGRPQDFTLEGARQDLGSVLDWARAAGYRSFVTVGEGLGAAIGLMETPADVACQVLLWPFIDLGRIARNIAASGKGDQPEIGAPLAAEMRAWETIEVLKAVKTPLLVMHGAQDERSPIDQLDLLRAHLGARRLEITSFQDGTHGLPKLNHRKTVYFHITQFIEKYT
jgi:uncharacterized protein